MRMLNGITSSLKGTLVDAQSTLAIAEPTHRSFDEVVSGRVDRILDGSYLGFAMSYQVGSYYMLHLASSGKKDIEFRLQLQEANVGDKTKGAQFTFFTSDRKTAYSLIPDGKNGATLYRKGKEEKGGILLKFIHFSP